MTALDRLLAALVVQFNDVHDKPCISCLLCDQRGTYIPYFKHAEDCPVAAVVAEFKS